MDGYNAFMLVATLLVLMMTTPALALFYGGMTRSKSVLNMMMMSYAAMAIVGIIWVLWGYSMVFSGEGGIDTFFNSPFANFALDGVGYDGYTFMMFQLTFAVITTALISGAIADRVKFSAWLVFVPIWATLSYFPLAHMVFGCTDVGPDLHPDRRPGLRRWHRGAHQRRCRRPGAGPGDRQARRLRP